METTQSVVTSRPVERPFWRRIITVVARRLDGTGPHFLPNVQNANFSGGTYTQAVGSTIHQHYYQDGRYLPSPHSGSTSGSTPVNSPSFRDNAEPVCDENGERLKSTTVTVPASQTPPIRRPQETYQDLLEREDYGFPFWVPAPNRSLLAEYRYEGVSIGDVGVFTSSGGFDYLFNICLPENDPRNSGGLPHNFQPLYPPLTSLDTFDFDEFDPGNYVANGDIRVNDGDIPLTSTITPTFVNRGLEGAILLMPNGASVKELANESRFQTYLTAERIASFYQFANDVVNGRGRGIGNGQLRVVFRTTNSTTFAMASVPPSAPSEQPTRLQIDVLDQRNRITGSAPLAAGALPTIQDRYFWNVSGQARVKTKIGPGANDQQGLDLSRVATGLKNQCLFVKALHLHLSQEEWNQQRLPITVTTPSEAANQSKINEASGTEASTGNLALGSSSNSVYLGGDNTNSGENSDNEVIQLVLCPHPSSVLARRVFKKYPHAKAVITSDRNWLYSEELRENILSPSPNTSKNRYDHVDQTGLHVSGYDLEEDVTDNILDLVKQESPDGVISFKPRGPNAEFVFHIQSLAKQFNTTEDIKAYIFGDTGGNRCSVVAHIVKTVLSEYNQKAFWQSTVGIRRSRRFERSTSFTFELYAHPWTQISLIEALLARTTLPYDPPDITSLKNITPGPTGEYDLVVISILAHRLQDRFRQNGQMDDLHQSIFYFKRIIQEHEIAKGTFQLAQKGSDTNLSTLFWVYPTVLIGLSTVLHIRLQIQKQEADYLLLLDCLEKQKQLDLIFSGAGKSKVTINDITSNFAVSTTVAKTGSRNDKTGLLYSHSATAGLLNDNERLDAPRSTTSRTSSMSIFPKASKISITGGDSVAVSSALASIGSQNDIVGILHSNSATAGLLDAKERFDAPKCDEGTRISMILGMKKFVQDGDAASSPGLYWLHGPAGVGKSALAQSLSLSLKDEGDHAASFFFSRTSSSRSDGNRLIVTLAYQLSTNIPALQPFISEVVWTNLGILSASNSVQMQGLIIDPINKWHKKYKWSIRRWTDRVINTKPHPRLILVDGLDECNDPIVQTDLILCIAAAVRRLSAPFRFVITSRPEVHILTTFELNPAFQGPGGVPVTKKNFGNDEVADEQITTFLLKEFAEIRRNHPIRNFLPPHWPRPDQIRQLVAKSSKGFIYVTTVIRYIRMPYNRPDECLNRILGLSEIPAFDKPYEPLDLLYRYIFESVPEVNKRSIHDIFHFLVIPSAWDGVTDPQTIEGYTGYPPGHVRRVLYDLLCLVEFDPSGRVKILHASLPDFLLDRSRSGPLHIEVREAHAIVATSYLSPIYLSLSNELLRRDNLFSTFLDHLMQANLSNTRLHHKLLRVDLLSCYRNICSGTTLGLHIKGDKGSINTPQTQIEIKSIALMAAYLLVLVIQDGPRSYIKDQIAAIKAFILETYPMAASVHTVHEEIVPAMATLFIDWTSTISDNHINKIFGCGVAPSQNELREAIFELHVLMMIPFCQDTGRSLNSKYDVETGCSRTEDPEQWIKGDSNYWTNIVLGRDYLIST